MCYVNISPCLQSWLLDEEEGQWRGADRDSFPVLSARTEGTGVPQMK